MSLYATDTGFETEGTEFSVSTTGTDEMDSLGSDTGTCFLSSGFESALLPVMGTLGARGGALMSAITADTHDC